MQRFTTPTDLMDAHPRPGQHESRYPQPRDRTMNHPLKEDSHA